MWEEDPPRLHDPRPQRHHCQDALLWRVLLRALAQTTDDQQLDWKKSVRHARQNAPMCQIENAVRAYGRGCRVQGPKGLAGLRARGPCGGPLSLAPDQDSPTRLASILSVRRFCDQGPRPSLRLRPGRGSGVGARLNPPSATSVRMLHQGGLTHHPSRCQLRVLEIRGRFLQARILCFRRGSNLSGWALRKDGLLRQTAPAKLCVSTLLRSCASAPTPPSFSRAPGRLPRQLCVVGGSLPNGGGFPCVHGVGVVPRSPCLRTPRSSPGALKPGQHERLW